MLRLEAPRNLVPITLGTDPTEERIELSNPASWMRAMVHQQEQAEQDLRQLHKLCGDSINRADRRIQDIERAYHMLAQRTQYVYDWVRAQKEVVEAWIRNELAAATNAYQTLDRQV